MSDSSDKSFCLNLNDYNYDDCIVTRNGDSSESDESSEISFSQFEKEPELPQQNEKDSDSEDFDILEMTIEQVAKAHLSHEDTFTFILVMLKKITGYLTKLSEDEHKKWLQHKLELVKTALITNCQSFDVKAIRDVNGETYVDCLTPNVSVKDSNQKRIGKSLTPNVTVGDKNKGKGSNQPVTNEGGNASHDQSGDLRRSTRLKIFAEENDVVYCDKIERVALKLQPYLATSTPVEKRGVNTDKTQQKRKSGTEKQSFIDSEKPQSHKRKMKSLGTENTKKDKRMSLPHGEKHKGRISSVGSSMNKRGPKKRKAASMTDIYFDERAKIMKNGASGEEPDANGVATSSNTSNSSKRKLYHEETWLNNLSLNIQEETPPKTD